MKIQCDVCSSEEASVFCCADEAALCGPCDLHIHSANKLAGKHCRFSLLNPNPNPNPNNPNSSKSNSHHAPPPICDICQEKRGYLFCKEDRAMLCWDCDVPIHNANTHTMKHSRFLLTGASLSSLPITINSTAAATSTDYEQAQAQELVPDYTSSNNTNSPPPPPQQHHPYNRTTTCNSDHNHNVNIIINDQLQDQIKIKAKLQEEEETLCTTTTTSHGGGSTNIIADGNGNSSSRSISEYLINLLPGWHVEDFLFEDAATNAATITTTVSGSYKHEDEMFFPFVERRRSSSSNSDELTSSSLAADEGLPIWVLTSGYVLDQRILSHENNIIQVKSSRYKRCNSEVSVVPEFHSIGFGHNSNSKRHRAD